jgi:hypothetical protein
VVGLEPCQAFFHGANHVLAVVAGVGNARGRRSSQGVFGGDDQAITLRGDELAEHGFRLATLITVGGVDEIAAGLQVAIKYALGFIAFGAMAPTRTKVTRAQRQFRNTQAGFSAEHFVMHGMTPGGNSR